MRKNWHLVSAIAVFLFTITGIGYVTSLRGRFESRQGVVLGEALANIHIDMTIEFDGQKQLYSTSELPPDATLKELLRLYDRGSAQGLEVRRINGKDEVARIGTFLSGDLMQWYISVNNQRYEGDFNEKILFHNDKVSLKYMLREGLPVPTGI